MEEKEAIIKSLISEVNEKEIYKFLLLLQQLQEDETVDIGVCTIQKVDDFIFKVKDVSVKGFFDGLA